MTANERALATDAARFQKAICRWDDDGGAEPDDPIEPAWTHEAPHIGGVVADITALQHLHVRVIALENLVIALLAHASSSNRELAREMAASILPRPGYTPHSLTIRAAQHMLNLAGRADQVRAETESGGAG